MAGYNFLDPPVIKISLRELSKIQNWPAGHGRPGHFDLNDVYFFMVQLAELFT